MPVPLTQMPDDNAWKDSGADAGGTSTMNSAMAAFHQGWNNSMTAEEMDIYNQFRANQDPNSPTLSVEELNTKYNGSGITWRSPQKANVAQMIVDDHDKQNALADRASRNVGTGQGVLNLAAGLAGGVADPQVLAIGAATGWALEAGGAALEAGTGLAAKFGSALTSEGLGGSVLRTGIEGTTVGSAMEAVNREHERLNQQDTDMTQSLKNVALMTGLGMGIGGVAHGIGAWLKPDESAALNSEAAAQMAEGKRPMLDPAIEDLKRAHDGTIDGKVEPGVAADRLAYEYEPVNASEPVSHTYYTGTQSTMDRLADVPLESTQHATTDFGRGLYASDKLSAENGNAAPQLAESAGLIHGFDLNDAKLLDTEGPLDKPTAGAFADTIEPIDKQVASDLRNGEINLHQAYDALPKEGAQALSNAAEKMGYDGLHFKDGSPEAPRNGTMIFPDRATDPNLLQEHPDSMQSDPSLRGGLSQGEIDAAQKEYASPKNDLFHSDAQDAQLKEIDKRAKEGRSTPEDQKYLDEQHASALEAAKNALNEGKLTKGDEALLKEIEGRAATAKTPLGEVPESEVGGDKPTLADKVKDGEGMLKAMYSCLGGNG